MEFVGAEEGSYGERIRYQARLNKDVMEKYLRRYAARVIVLFCFAFVVFVIPLLISPLIVLLCWPTIASKAHTAAEKSHLYVTDSCVVYQFGFRPLRIPLANIQSIRVANGCYAVLCTGLCMNNPVVEAVVVWRVELSCKITKVPFVGLEDPESFVEYVRDKIRDNERICDCCSCCCCC